ncbi:hypothetical protein [Cystobacter ferrugineus]|uniref:hypothetical protein n=1 Tax=Cystobacter ferrugineus TaxID=83449 RepID=UPI00116153E4|nr:hypothetical protein [Cystobacter ferrugineus]
MVEKVVQAGETVQGLLTVQRLLTEAELAEVQAVVEQCVAQAHADINGAYQKQNGTVLTNNKRDSLKPDLVVHATRNATDIQCVLEFKFPCYERHRLDPIRSPGVEAQLKGYMRLSKDCRVSLVTPNGSKLYEGK